MLLTWESLTLARCAPVQNALNGADIASRRIPLLIPNDSDSGGLATGMYGLNTWYLCTYKLSFGRGETNTRRDRCASMGQSGAFVFNGPALTAYGGVSLSLPCPFQELLVSVFRVSRKEQQRWALSCRKTISLSRAV